MKKKLFLLGCTGGGVVPSPDPPTVPPEETTPLPEETTPSEGTTTPEEPTTPKPSENPGDGEFQVYLS